MGAGDGPVREVEGDGGIIDCNGKAEAQARKVMVVMRVMLRGGVVMRARVTVNVTVERITTDAH